MATVLQVSALLLVGVLAISAQTPSCPDIIPSAGWGARQGRFIPTLPIRPAPFLIVHGANTATCTGDQLACSRIIRDVQSFHMDGNGWPDISYHFIIGNGRIFEGRGWGRQGQNVEEFSNQAINVAFIGTFAVNSPTEENHGAILESLIQCGIASGALASNVSVIAQCQATGIVACDATNIFEWVSTRSRFQPYPRPI